MSVLEKIENRVSELKAKLGDIQAELSELEIAAKVLRRMDSSPAAPLRRLVDLEELDDGDDEQAASDGDFVGMTIKDIAASLLKDRGGVPVHFRVLAQDAINRGYQGRRNNNPESIANSFFALMNRNRDVFEPVGNGAFRLKESAS